MSQERPHQTAKRPPGRPPAFARDEAVEAAMQLLWKRGFPSVTARDLADGMAIQRSSFYNSFGSREAVFREALARYAAAAPDAALADLLPDQPALPLLVDVFRRACRARAADAKGCMVCNSVAELVGVHAELGPLLEAAVGERIAAVERLLAQAVARGELTVAGDDLPATAKSVVAFLMGLNTVSKVVRDERELWAMSRTFLAGLGVAPELLDPAAEKRGAPRGRRSPGNQRRAADG